MIRGLYASALGMTVQMRKMDVTADNIANVNTTGYKKDTAVNRSFSDILLWRLDDPVRGVNRNVSIGPSSQGVFVDDVYTDFSGGGFAQTGAPLDLAIAGDGFFSVSVQDANGRQTEMYTRGGAFALAADGTLITTEGGAVLGAGGPIRIPQGRVSISKEGRVYANGVFVDTLKITDFTDKRALRKSGDSLFTADSSAQTADFQGEVQQGFLESSNVSVVREMVDMIKISRAFEANQRMIAVHDTALGRAVNDIARK